MPPVAAMPDAEAIAVTVLAPLRTRGVVVGTEWPESLAKNLPVVAVSLGGGGSRQQHVTADRVLDIDVLAATKAEAADLVAEVSALLQSAAGTVQAGARVYGVEETSLVWLPDEATNTPRYVLVMSVVVRPA